MPTSTTKLAANLLCIGGRRQDGSGLMALDIAVSTGRRDVRIAVGTAIATG